MNSLISNSEIYFRLDYGGPIGRGHLSRCLALAEVFKEKGFNPIFVIRKRPSIATEKLPFKLIWLTEAQDVSCANTESWRVGTEESEANEMLPILKDNSLVILDHYALGISFQKILRLKKHKLVLFQDTQSDIFDADILINYNVGVEKKDYEKINRALLSTFLVGPSYAPLSVIFAKEHRLRFDQNTQVEIVGVYFGGIELKYLEKVAKAISKMEYFSDKKLEWVVNSDEEKSLLKVIFQQFQIRIYVRLPQLLDLYKKVQLFIGACGISFLERACLGLWQINFLVADNQQDIAAGITANHLGTVVVDLRSMNEDEIITGFEEELKHPRHDNATRVGNVFSLIDGEGVNRIVMKCLEELR